MCSLQMIGWTFRERINFNLGAFHFEYEVIAYLLKDMYTNNADMCTFRFLIQSIVLLLAHVLTQPTD